MELMRIERSETVKVNKLLIASNEKLDASNAIAMFPVHGDSAVDLIQQADLIMYDQKRKQRGSIGVFNETLHSEIKREQRRSILLKLTALLYRIALKRVIP